jgi:hypothetical protein
VGFRLRFGTILKHQIDCNFFENSLVFCLVDKAWWINFKDQCQHAETGFQ